MKVAGRPRLDHGGAFGIERDEGDRIPVSGVPRPVPRVACPGGEVKRVAGFQHRAILTGMSLSRADVADAAVAMIVVVPTHGGTRPGLALA
jgi:hypothetical protein